MERIKGCNAGYTASVCEATPPLLEQRDHVFGTRPEHEGVGIVAQRCKQARLSLEATLTSSQSAGRQYAATRTERCKQLGP